MVWSAGTVSTGALFASVTTTVKLLLSLSAGTPLSLTFTVIRFVLGPWPSVGVHVSTPVVGLTLTPEGPDTKLNASVLAGTSVSVAVFVTTSVLNSVMFWSAGTVSTGALFASVNTFPTRLSSDLAGTPLSITFTVIRFVLGPWPSVGVHVSTPVVGLRLTPEGPDTRLNVSVLAGTSVSVAVFVTTSVLNSAMV